MGQSREQKDCVGKRQSRHEEGREKEGVKLRGEKNNKKGSKTARIHIEDRKQGGLVLSSLQQSSCCVHYTAIVFLAKTCPQKWCLRARGTERKVTLRT